jgi:hypothetical protein
MLTGLEIDKPERSNVFDYDDMAHARIVGEVDAPNGLGYTAAFKRESRLPGGLNKAAVVSPLEMLAQGRDQVSEIQRQMKNLTRIVNRELRALADAGCRNAQLDAPVLGWQVNIGAMTTRAAAELITACLEGVTARKSLHLCNGNLRGRPISRVLSCAPWVGILRHLDGVINVAHLEVKYYSQYLERDAFREMPRASNSRLALSTKAAIGSSRPKRFASARQIGPGWSVRNGSGSHPRAASVAIRHATSRCSEPSWRT